MKLLCVPLMVLILVFGCTVPPEAPVNPPIPSAESTPLSIECNADSDCMTGGCSGTLCVAKNTEPVFSTCEWKEEYSCYQQISCGCIEGECAWAKTSEFERCMAVKRSDIACATDTDCGTKVCVDSRCVAP